MFVQESVIKVPPAGDAGHCPTHRPQGGKPVTPRRVSPPLYKAQRPVAGITFLQRGHWCAMALLRLFVLVALSCVLATEARPRYVLVPLRAVMPLVRHTRSVRQYQPVQARADPQEYLPVQARADPQEYQEYLPSVLPAVRQDYYEVEEQQVPQASDSYGTHHGQSDTYGHNDHVDYGAYTGGYGAFGWYSDHPVCINCGGYH